MLSDYGLLCTSAWFPGDLSTIEVLLCYLRVGVFYWCFCVTLYPCTLLDKVSAVKMVQACYPLGHNLSRIQRQCSSCGFEKQWSTIDYMK